MPASAEDLRRDQGATSPTKREFLGKIRINGGKGRGGRLLTRELFADEDWHAHGKGFQHEGSEGPAQERSWEKAKNERHEARTASPIPPKEPGLNKDKLEF